MKTICVLNCMLFSLLLWSAPCNAETKTEKQFANYAQIAQTFQKLVEQYQALQQNTVPLTEKVIALQAKLAELEKILATKNFAAFNDPQAPKKYEDDNYYYKLSISDFHGGIRRVYGDTSDYTSDYTRTELKRITVLFDSTGKPSPRTSELFDATLTTAYRLFVHRSEDDSGKLLNAIDIEKEEKSSGIMRRFYDHDADGFYYLQYNEWQYQRAQSVGISMLYDVFTLTEGKDKSQVFSFVQFDYDYGYAVKAAKSDSDKSAITPTAVNKAYIPILKLLTPELNIEITDIQAANSSLEKLAAALEQEINAKEEEIRVTKMADEIARRERERRQILGDTYDAMLVQTKKASEVTTLEDFQDLVRSVETIDDVRNILADRPIVYPAEGTSKKTIAHGDRYASPWTTHVRGYGVCDEQALHAAAFLQVLLQKKKIANLHLAVYGYKSPDGLQTSHAVALIQLNGTKKKPGRWRYFTNDLFSSQTFSDRTSAMKASSQHVGYDQTKLTNVRYREITASGTWLYNDQASAKLEP